MAHVVPQPTPNPQAYKFTVEGHTFAKPTTVGSAAAAAGTPFAGLFRLPGVVSVFATANFVTITKAPGADWSAIIEPARKALEKAF
jgi:hypothetical protein